jgi:catechol 2,3-dioxygenase-like lactoylglutathione lyase family enzyme
MEILFVAGFAPIVPNPVDGASFYKGTLGLPLEVVSGDYLAVDGFGGTKHLGIWPLADAAQSCFGTSEWPSDVPIPQATLEFEVADVDAAVVELITKGHTLIHNTRVEPWGQTIARLLGPEGLLIGLCITPWLHEPK